jgi:hypothetical protein
VPRVVNGALAAVLLVFLVPIATHLGDVGTSARVLLLVIAVPFVLLALACACSALWPGSLGRLAHRSRQQP